MNSCSQVNGGKDGTDIWISFDIQVQKEVSKREGRKAILIKSGYEGHEDILDWDKSIRNSTFARL